MELEQQRQLQRTISGPVHASIQTMNHASFLVLDDIPPSDDSDEEDLDRYVDVGLREQLFITLSRAIRSVQNTEQKITESSIPNSSMKNKQAAQTQTNSNPHKVKSKNKTKNRNKSKHKNKNKNKHKNMNHQPHKRVKRQHFKQTNTVPNLSLSTLNTNVTASSSSSYNKPSNISIGSPYGDTTFPKMNQRYTIAHPSPRNRNHNRNGNRNTNKNVNRNTNKNVNRNVNKNVNANTHRNVKGNRNTNRNRNTTRNRKAPAVAPLQNPQTSVTPTISPKNHNLNMPASFSMNNTSTAAAHRRGAIYAHISSRSQPLSPSRPIQRRITMQIPPPPKTPPPPVPAVPIKQSHSHPIRYTQFMRQPNPQKHSKHPPLRTTIAMPSKPPPKKNLPPLIRSKTRAQALTPRARERIRIQYTPPTRRRGRSRSEDHIDHMVLKSIQPSNIYKSQKTKRKQIASTNKAKKVPPSKRIPSPPEKLWRKVKTEPKYNHMHIHSVSSSSRTTITTHSSSSQSSNSIHSLNSSQSSSNYGNHNHFFQNTRNRNETVAGFSSYQQASPPSPPSIAVSAPTDAFLPPAPSFVFPSANHRHNKPSAAAKKKAKKRRPEAPMQVYSYLPMRNKLETMNSKPIEDPESPPSPDFVSHTNVRSDSHFKSKTLNSFSPRCVPENIALKITISKQFDYSSSESDDTLIPAAEYMLADPTLDPKRNIEYEMNKNPLRFIRPRGATWICNVPHMNGKRSSSPTELSPSTTAPAVSTRLDRTDSLLAGFEGATMEDGHIVLKQSSYLDIERKQIHKQFKNGFPDFVHLHQKFSQEFANKIFDGQLKSYQRAFIPISPEHLGLMDFSNIRSRRRALFGGDKLAHKPFNDHDTESTMDIKEKEREKVIAKYMNNDKGATNKLKKLVSAHVAPRLKNNKGSATRMEDSSEATQSYLEWRTINNKKKRTSNAWQKLLHKIRNGQEKNSNHEESIRYRKQNKTSFTLDDPADVRQVIHHSCDSIYNMTNKTKDDMMMQYSNDSDDDADTMYQTEFGLNQITNSVDSRQLKRGDLIFIIEHQHIDVENLDLNSFVTKYKMQNFLRRMADDSKNREHQMRIIRERSTRRLLSSPLSPTTNTVYTINRLGKINEMYTTNEELQDIQMLQELQNMGTAKHVMIVLQNIGSSIEIAHVTSHGGIRSFIKEFDAEKIAHTLYYRDKNTERRAHNEEYRTARGTSTNVVEALGRGPPVAYRCVVYRLNTNVLHSATFANEAANVAENLVKCGRVLSDPTVFHPNVAIADSEQDARRRNSTNPEKYFYRFLLNSDSSLFRRMVRLQFDGGTNFFNFSSSEFVALCYQRALVNKRSFDRELIRLLDFYPRATAPSLLQKYFHLNIDEHGDWKCLGNVFFSYL